MRVCGGVGGGGVGQLGRQRPGYSVDAVEGAGEDEVVVGCEGGGAGEAEGAGWRVWSGGGEGGGGGQGEGAVEY